jgi:hypothetical protein
MYQAYDLDLRYDIEHSSQSTSFIRDQLGSYPSNGRYTCGIEPHVADDRDKDQSARPSDFGALNLQCRQVDRDKAERDRCDKHTNRHAEYRNGQEAPAAEFVH